MSYMWLDPTKSVKCIKCGNQLVYDVPESLFREFPHLSQTADPPTAVESVAIQEDLPARQREIEALEDQISQLHMSIGILKSRKDVAIRALRIHKGMLNPVRRLPVELLRTIFSLCSLVSTPIEPRSSCSSMQYGQPREPWNLSYVSQRWREIAISIPEIWTSIDSTSFFSNKSNTQLALERSGPSLPLDIGFVKSDRFHTSLKPSLIATLLPYSPRWRSLHLEIEFTVEELRSLHGRIDSLEYLYLRCPCPTAETSQLFEIAPALKEVVVIYARPWKKADIPTPFQFPWCSLAKYSSRSEDGLSVHLGSLNLCGGSLTVLHLSNVTQRSVNPLPQSIILPNLEKLAVSFSDTGLTSLLGKLTLPSLRCLSLAPFSWETWDATDHEAWGSLLNRSRCALETLKLDSPMNFKSAIVRSFSAASSIRELILKSCEDPDIFSYLYCPSSASSLLLLPNLTHLTITMYSSWSILAWEKRPEERQEKLDSEENVGVD
ncbi:hypothetical protein C8J56DRAFT_323785 [Mycena floridula]|nr:hypothetical protein C8J56DRAFT_323785 [Mycena floridula]